MKRSMILLVILILPVLLLSKSGIGIILGEPTGISFKMWTSETTAFDAALAYSFADKEHFYVHVNHLWHSTIDLGETKLPWFWGIGGNIRYREAAKDKVRVAGRIPLGIYHMFETFPADIFLEVAPGLDVIPEISFSFGAAIGIRFYIF
ncbi:MAG: hypothetical protein K0B81_04745 [Candidatus Cloacimonetes bacterium]|nr:hypothetical protein [Candidatus Cloacimonadota bacterium]